MYDFTIWNTPNLYRMELVVIQLAMPMCSFFADTYAIDEFCTV